MKHGFRHKIQKSSGVEIRPVHRYGVAIEKHRLDSVLDFLH